MMSDVDHQDLAFWHQPALHGCQRSPDVSVPSKPWMSSPACCRKLLGLPFLKTSVSASSDHSGSTYLRPWLAFVRSGSFALVRVRVRVRVRARVKG